MPDPNLVADIIEAVHVLADESATGDVAGGDLARYLGRDPEDPELYHALRYAERRGDVDCDWPGGMELPYAVRTL